MSRHGRHRSSISSGGGGGGADKSGWRYCDQNLRHVTARAIESRRRASVPPRHSAPNFLIAAATIGE